VDAHAKQIELETLKQAKEVGVVNNALLRNIQKRITKVIVDKAEDYDAIIQDIDDPENIRLEKIESFKIGIDAGILTINEIRKQMGIVDWEVPGGDQILLNSEKYTLDSVITDSEELRSGAQQSIDNSIGDLNDEPENDTNNA